MVYQQDLAVFESGWKVKHFWAMRSVKVESSEILEDRDCVWIKRLVNEETKSMLLTEWWWNWYINI